MKHLFTTTKIRAIAALLTCSALAPLVSADIDTSSWTIPGSAVHVSSSSLQHMQRSTTWLSSASTNAKVYGVMPVVPFNVSVNLQPFIQSTHRDNAQGSIKLRLWEMDINTGGYISRMSMTCDQTSGWSLKTQREWDWGWMFDFKTKAYFLSIELERKADYSPVIKALTVGVSVDLI
jgi:hypothetical protein